MDNVKVLHIGEVPLSDRYNLIDVIDVQLVRAFEEWPEKLRPDVVIIERVPEASELEVLQDMMKAYTVYITDSVEFTEELQYFCDSKAGKILTDEELAEFLADQIQYYYADNYGEKLKLKDVSIAHGFDGSISWKGNCEITLEGDFGDSLNQIAYWRGNIPLYSRQVLDVWFEFDKSDDVEVGLKVVQFRNGRVSEIINEWVFTEEELSDIVHLINGNLAGAIFYSVLARGKGTLKIKALHERYSKGETGSFIPGGDRYVTSEGEEIFFYFDPGDLKPPLNIYFSGYKTKEGFEAYNLFRSKGKPFLLVAETRLEGGAFYLGSAEYENLLKSCIRNYISKLGFTNKDVIMSGLSMGTFGAIYYACDIMPGIVLMGKPLFSIGNVAGNEKLNRPGGFPTSVDLLLYLYGATDQNAIDRLNARFWDKFNRTNWSRTKFVISYMYEDDYDSDAYQMLISNMKSVGARIYGKGLHGRHNDDTNGIVEWFDNQLDKAIEELG